MLGVATGLLRIVVGEESWWVSGKSIVGQRNVQGLLVLEEGWIEGCWIASGSRPAGGNYLGNYFLIFLS